MHLGAEARARNSKAEDGFGYPLAGTPWTTARATYGSGCVDTKPRGIEASWDALSATLALPVHCEVLRNASRNNARTLTGTERYSEVLDPKVVTL